MNYPEQYGLNKPVAQAQPTQPLDAGPQHGHATVPHVQPYPPAPNQYGQYPVEPYGPPPQAHWGQQPQQFGPVYPYGVQQNVIIQQQVQKRGCNHLLHLVLTILTAGLWLPIWIICAIVQN